MRAAWYEKTGPARDVLQIGDLPDPKPGPGEVRVRLSTSGVNPTDTKRRYGTRGRGMEFPRIVPHSDGAGVIDAVGDGVARSQIGERVWTFKALTNRPMGTAAEYVVLPAPLTAHLPAHVDFAEGACLGIPAMTAHRCVFADGPVRGQPVLVAGGAGAVGNAAVQLAKWGGALVITTVSGPDKEELARGAGADHVINYRTEDVVRRVMDITEGKGVDRVVEVAFGRNLAIDIAATAPHAGIVCYSSDEVPEPHVPYHAIAPRNLMLRFVNVTYITEEQRAAAVRDVVAALEAKALRPVVWRRFPLEKIALAHEAVESGEAMGNVVVDIR